MSGLREEPLVRRATPAEHPRVAAMLMRAFLDDPVAAWAFGPGTSRPRPLERFHAIRMRQLAEHEEIWTTDDLSCAAVWSPPDRWRLGMRGDAELLPCFAHPRLFWRVPLVALGWGLLEREHPRTPPAWYLAVLGTDPAAQGRGLGSAVLRSMLERCDSEGVGAYLESSKERNIDFYARHGFRVMSEVRLLRGPSMWPMWRDPR